MPPKKEQFKCRELLDPDQPIYLVRVDRWDLIWCKQSFALAPTALCNAAGSGLKRSCRRDKVSFQAELVKSKNM